MPPFRPRLPLAAAILTLVFSGLPRDGAAMEFAPLADHPEGCTARATGVIERGDLLRLRRLFPGPEIGDLYTEAAPRLCLDSPGGDFPEALRIAEFLREKGIGTHVARSEQCLSACGIAFLGGTRVGFEDAVVRTVDRSIHAEATLGFHAPPLDVPPGQFSRAQVLDAFDVAMRTAGEIFAKQDLLNLSRDFTAKIFSTPSDGFLHVDTVARALDARVSVEGLRPLPEELSETQLREICERIGPEMRPDHFAHPESTRKFEAVKGMTLSPAPTGARRGAWLTGYWAEGDLYWTVCEVRWLQPRNGLGGVSARVLQQPLWNGQADAPRNAPPTPAEIQNLIDTATEPFAFFDPIAIFPGASRLSDLASGKLPAEADTPAPALPTVGHCAPTAARYRVANVRNFATLRAAPGFDAKVLEEVARDGVVEPLAQDDSALSILTQGCIAACDRADGSAAAGETCRASNDVWWLVRSAANNEGWMSSRYLVTP